MLAKIQSVLFLGLLVLGAYLRLYHIQDQVILDDEWHAIYNAFQYSFQRIASTFSVNDNCIPLTLYTKFLLSLGWLNEITLRLPQLLSGLAAVALIPLFAKKMLPQLKLTLLIGLLAIAPFLIFYSRFSRPYSICFLLVFIAVFALWQWSKNTRISYLITFAIAAGLSIYLHLFSLLTIFTALVVVSAIHLKKYDFPTLLTPWIAILTTSALLLAPAIGTIDVLLDNAWKPPIRLDTLLGAAHLIAGTESDLLTGLFFLFSSMGFWFMWRDNAKLTLLFLSIILVQASTILILRPSACWSSIVIARYFIPALPFLFIATAYGAEKLFYFDRKKDGSQTLFCKLIGLISCTVFLFILFFSGPLMDTFQMPNNFTNHSAYQENYQSLNLNRSYDSDFEPWCYINRAEVPTFYEELGNLDDALTIIEYPKWGMDHISLYYYYQRIHKKNVLLGVNNQQEAMAFRNFINVHDINKLLASGATYLILHKTLPLKDNVPGFA